MDECKKCKNYKSYKCNDCYVWDYEKGETYTKFEDNINLVQSQCCECGTYGLCNQKTNLCLDCDKAFEIEKKQLIDISKKMIEEYQDKIEFYIGIWKNYYS